MHQAVLGGCISIQVVTPSGTAVGAPGDDEAQATAESAGAAEQRFCQAPSENLRPRRQPAAAAAPAADSRADDNDRRHTSSEDDDDGDTDGSEESAASEDDAAADAGECGSDDMDWERQQQPAAARPADDGTTQAAARSSKRRRQQQAGSNARQVARRRAATAAAAAVLPSGAAGGRRHSRGGRRIAIEELPGGIIQSSADAMTNTNSVLLPKAFAGRCFPRLPCEVPLQLDMAPDDGAGVASERPAGAPTAATAKLNTNTRGVGRSRICMSSAQSTAGLSSYRGFKIIAWQAAKPNSSGSNSSRLTMVLQSPAAQQAVAAAAEQAAAEAAAAVDSSAAGGGAGSERTWHSHCWTVAKEVQPRQVICPMQLVAAAFLPHHPAGTRSLQLQLSVFKDGQSVIAAAETGGDSIARSLAFRNGTWSCSLPAPVSRLVSHCELQLMRAAAPNLLQVFVVSASSNRQRAGFDGDGDDNRVLTAALLGPTPGSTGVAARPADHNTSSSQRQLQQGGRQHQAAPAQPPAVAQLPAGYELPPVDSAAAGMQQLLGLLQLLQADQALLAKFTAKLGRLQQAPVGDRQLHWFAVSYEMVRTWLQQGRLDMVLQSLEVALA